jgi:hypothetical protein
MATVDCHLAVQRNEAGVVITHDPMPVVLADLL